MNSKNHVRMFASRPAGWRLLSVAAAAFSFGLVPSIFAQATTSPKADQPKEVVELPTFVITENSANPYLSKQALSASRVAMDIQDIPQTVSVVTKEFIQDSFSARMLDAAKYVTPVVENTLPF